MLALFLETRLPSSASVHPLCDPPLVSAGNPPGYRHGQDHMKMPGLSRISAKLQRLLPRRRPVGLVLLYHRIAAPATDPQLLAVTPERFAGQIRHLSSRFEMVSLHELANRMPNARRGSRMIAVTFDDGYADNLSQAKPILESCKVPATVFVATGALATGSAFWWDELEQLLLHPSRLPSSLTLEIDGQVFQWEAGGDVEYTNEDFASHRKWNVLQHDDPTRRHGLYRTLCRRLKPMTEESRRRALCDLRAWAALTDDRSSQSQMLTKEDLRRLVDGPWVEVGAHTASHQVLANLSLAEQRAEIASSKQCLEAIVSRPVRTFAYPYGTKTDYSGDTATLVKEQGFALACSNYPEAVTRTSDVYQLPRFVVRNWTEERFGRTLDAWWDGREGDGHGDC
ncbi:MAG TPA: polysaccharide deacetylase family protein [Nitrospira sp.]